MLFRSSKVTGKSGVSFSLLDEFGGLSRVFTLWGSGGGGGLWDPGASEPDLLFPDELSPRDDMLRRFRMSRQDMMTVSISVGLD